MNDFERMLQDSDSHKLLAVVTTVHHQRIGNSFNDGALSLAESLSGVSTSTVGQKFGILLLNSQVVLKTIDKLSHVRERIIHEIDDNVHENVSSIKNNVAGVTHLLKVEPYNRDNIPQQTIYAATQLTWRLMSEI